MICTLLNSSDVARRMSQQHIEFSNELYRPDRSTDTSSARTDLEVFHQTRNRRASRPARAAPSQPRWFRCWVHVCALSKAKPPTRSTSGALVPNQRQVEGELVPLDHHAIRSVTWHDLFTFVYPRPHMRTVSKMFPCYRYFVQHASSV